MRAVLGRDVLGVGEIRRMNYITNLARYHALKAGAKDWAAFAAKNPDANRLLNDAMIASEDVTNGE